jgi:hypothetical protein
MGQLKFIELTETYTGIRFQDFEKIQSESQFLHEKHINVSKPTRLGTFLLLGYSEILFKVCLFLATNLAGLFSKCYSLFLFQTPSYLFLLKQLKTSLFS